jgi:hypothetical protein
MKYAVCTEQVAVKGFNLDGAVKRQEKSLLASLKEWAAKYTAEHAELESPNWVVRPWI